MTMLYSRQQMSKDSNVELDLVKQFPLCAVSQRNKHTSILNPLKRKYPMVVVPKVRTLGELRRKASIDPKYGRLAQLACENLGGPANTELQESLSYLQNCAIEMDEDLLMDEVNSLRDLL